MAIADDDRALWRERDRTLDHDPGEGARFVVIRPEIRASWRRSKLTGITPGTDNIPYVEGLPDDSRLLRAAKPVVDQLELELSTAPVTILLADSGARIVDRRAGGSKLRARLDEARVAPGFSYAEDATGTNGIGTALEERRLFKVQGGEHFRESLQNLTCVGKPIIHPIGGRIEGILDVTCAVRDSNPLMGPLVESAVREIEHRLYEMASRDERALLEDFLRASRKGSRAVVTMSADLIMATPAASRLLEPEDKTLLWNWACLRLATRDEYIGEVQLANEFRVMARARRLDDGKRAMGVAVEFRLPVSRSAPRSPTHERSVLVPTEFRRPGARGASQKPVPPAFQSMVNDPGPTLVTGGHGVGKRHAVLRLHELWGRTDTLLEHDLALDAPRDARLWVGDLRERLSSGQSVLLRHIEALDDAQMTPVVSFLELANRERWPLLLTGPVTPEGTAVRAYAHFQRRLTVEPLATRTGEIEEIAHAILRGIAGSGQAQRLQPTALQSLMSQPWPGNVRELESVVVAAAHAALGGDIGLQHLPVGYRDSSGSRNLTPMERAEIDTIIRALREAKGNKSNAATILGTARSTLYRKIRTYGIDSDRFFTLT